jgi:lysophospholipase L1-like esterase
LNAEVINLGFSGNGRGEPELARIISEIADPALFVLEFDANVPSLELLKERLPAFIRILREQHGRTPILVVSRPPFAKDIHDPKALADRIARADFQRQAVEECRRAGDRRIEFCDGATLMGESFHECTVDGVHPTDLGFWRLAQSMEPVIRRLALSAVEGMLA